ncbi:MAG: hypothetical protein ACKOW9_05405 [Candidatus Paceibacterota bacterium]
MKYLLVLCISLFAVFGVVEAVGLSQQFAGIIIHTKALRIQTLETAGYVCIVPGQTIEIRPKAKRGIQPTSYMIPSGTISKTKNTLGANQQIIGKYSGKTIITCVHPLGDVQTVELDTITMYGNSAR